MDFSAGIKANVPIEPLGVPRDVSGDNNDSTEIEPSKI